jgi:hypothetical protein
VDPHQTNTRMTFWLQVLAFFSISFVYVLLRGTETVADTLMPSMLVPNIAQGYGIDLSRMRVGIDLLKDQPLYYWSTPKYGLVGIYPIGMAILVAPLQAFLWALAYCLGMEVSVVSPQFAQTRFILEKLTASCLAAVTALYVYRSLRAVIQRRFAICIVSLYLVGSSSLSLLAQGLWQQTGVNLLTSMLLYFLLSRRERPTISREVAFFAAIGFLFAVRPTAVVWSVFFASVYWKVYGRPSIAGVLSAVFAALPALAWNITIFGRPLGGYATVRSVVFDLDPGQCLSRLGLILFSAHKGLFVFNPFSFWIVFLWFYRKRLEGRLQFIVVALLCAELCSLALCSTNPTWHGGRGFGPRYMTESLGVLFVLSAIAISHVRERFSRTSTLGFTVVALYSVALNVFGAIGARLNSPALVDLHQRMLLP